MEKKNVFNSDEAFSEIKLDIKNTTLPKAYGLIKVHKPQFPVRIIVSFVNSPLYQFDKCISKFFSSHLKKPLAAVKNNLEVKNLLKNNCIPKNYEFISLDVVAMFPSLPHQLILESLAKKWNSLKRFLPLTKQEFLSGIKTLLSSTYIQFNNKFYKQINGAPMGFCSSPWLADITIEALETNALNKLKSSNALNNNNNYFSSPPLYSNDTVLAYKRFADDILLVVKKDNRNKVLDTFNNYHPKIKFTLETENDNKISFLDLEITRIEDNYILTNWYRKKTFSGRYLNFHSHHPLSQKRAIIYSLVDKVFNLSNPSFHEKNFKLIKKFLIANDYPKKFIEHHLNKRKNFINKKAQYTSPVEKTSQKFKNKKFFILPFHKYITPKLNKLFKNSDSISIKKTTNKLNHIIKLGKDKIETLKKSNIVYKINCKNCTANYIGQSKRNLEFRVQEHKRDVNNKKKTSALANHVINTSHTIDIKNIKVIDQEKNYRKRIFSEMLHIHNNSNTMNKMEDTKNLKMVYKNTLNLLKQFHSQK